MNYNINSDFTDNNKLVTIEINSKVENLNNKADLSNNIFNNSKVENSDSNENLKSSNICINLEDKMKSKEDKFKFMFMRYKKLILITTKAMKRPKIEFTDFQRILKYM